MLARGTTMSTAIRQWHLQRIFIHNQTHLLVKQKFTSFPPSCTDTSIATVTGTGITGVPCNLKIQLSLSSHWNSTDQLWCNSAEKSQRREDASNRKYSLPAIGKRKDAVELCPHDIIFSLCCGQFTGIGIALVDVCSNHCNVGAALLLVASSLLRGCRERTESQIILQPSRLRLTDKLLVADNSS